MAMKNQSGGIKIEMKAISKHNKVVFNATQGWRTTITYPLRIARKIFFSF
jgi:hypothetical protein